MYYENINKNVKKSKSALRIITNRVSETVKSYLCPALIANTPTTII